MLRIFLIFYFLFLLINGHTQNSKITAILKEKEIKVDYYEMTKAGSKVLFLPMEFGKSEFTYSQQDAIKNLKNVIIARVDLIYSDFPSNQDFSQLTKKRFESLQRILPQLLDNPNIEFRKVRQTIAKTKEVAETLEHGFFIYFRPMPTLVSSKKEIEKIKMVLSRVEDITYDKDLFEIDSAETPFWCEQITISFDTTIGFIPKIPKGATRETSKISLKEAFNKGYINENDKKDYLLWGDSVYVIEDRRDEDCTSIDASYFVYDLIDSTVSSVFKRNKWSKAMVIADVTGSMYPYTGQLLKWLAVTLTDKQKRYFVFFNDGDNKEDADKVIGKTGGIYSVYTNSYDEVEKTIEKAMLNGWGGDAPENNIEALLESDRLCDNCDSIVMIVDNWAPVKDISLLVKYRKPVKVVVCGVFERINKDYLKLVRETKGSLHLIEEDIYNLAELKEGESIIIHGINYKLLKGDFVDMNTKSI